MMTREEALKLLEYPIYKWSMDWDEREDGLNYSEVIELAISALRPVSREQVEKVWRGGWTVVRESEITGFNPEFAGHDPIGGYKCSRCKAEAVLDCNDEFVLDNFCPRCGAAMTNEAVEMVMERMEEMKNG